MYSFYVSRKPDMTNNCEYWAFVLEGEGIHLHETIKQPLADNFRDKMNIIKAYLWALDTMKAVVELNNITLNSITYYMPNDTIRKWLEYYVMNDENCIKPPARYNITISSLFDAIEAVPSYYKLAYIGSNRANAYANANFAEASAERKEDKEKAIDYFNNITEG